VVKTLAAIVRPAIANAVPYSEYGVNRALGIYCKLWLLRMLGSDTAGELDWFTGYCRAKRTRAEDSKAELSGDP
jgi:hypothetical protein